MKYDLKKSFKAEAAQEYFAKLITKKAYIELREIKLKRKLDQNGLYWVWLSCLQNETEIDKHELHYLFRAHFLPKPEGEIIEVLQVPFYQQLKRIISGFKYVPGMNEVIDVISYSTTDLDIAQFAAYLTQIKEFSRVNFNVVLLNLEDEHFMEFYKEYGFR